MQQQDRLCGIALRNTYPFLGTGFLQGVCRRAVRAAPLALREECESEAWLVLWQAHDKLERLPEAERGAYAAVCVRHRIGEICRRERQRRARLVSLDVLDSVTESRREAARERAEWDAPFRARLDDQIDRPDLAAALRALPGRDHTLLDLYYAGQLTDSGIARRWNVSPGAVKMQRHRAINKIRQALGRAAPR
jgi:RNA polymerase sigma factor (sigma-70 family)